MKDFNVTKQKMKINKFLKLEGTETVLMQKNRECNKTAKKEI